MTALSLLFKLLRWSRDIKAVRKNRVPQRVWNRGVSSVFRRVRGRLYR